MTVAAASDKSFYRLIRRYLAFYRDELLNPHWDGSFQVHHNKRWRCRCFRKGWTLCRPV